MKSSTHTSSQNSFTHRESRPPFQILHLEELYPNSSYCEEAPIQLSHYEFIWVMKGRGWLNIDFQQHAIVENCIYPLSPGQFRQLRFTGDIEGYYISASMDFYSMMDAKDDYVPFNSMVTDSRNIPCIRPENERLYELSSITRMLLKEYQRNSFLRLEILRGYLKLFTLYLSIDLSEKQQDTRPARDEEIAMKFIMLVKKNFMTKKQVADYADELHLSANYLNQIVKKVSGFTASYYIQQCIILEAKRKAIPPSTSMKEVAFYLGFNDCAHFSRYFKNNCGMSFTSFKKGLAVNR